MWSFFQSFFSGGQWSWSHHFGHGSGGHQAPAHAASVPEIDAASGGLAIAVVAAALLLAYEIRRRRA